MVCFLTLHASEWDCAPYVFQTGIDGSLLEKHALPETYPTLANAVPHRICHSLRSDPWEPGCVEER
jgi:hypothetical protein